MVRKEYPWLFGGFIFTIFVVLGIASSLFIPLIETGDNTELVYSVGFIIVFLSSILLIFIQYIIVEDKDSEGIKKTKEHQVSYEFPYLSSESVNTLKWFSSDDILRLYITSEITKIGVCLFFIWLTFAAVLGVLFMFFEWAGFSSVVMTGTSSTLATGFLSAGLMLGLSVGYYVYRFLSVFEIISDYINPERFTWYGRVHLDALVGSIGVVLGIYVLLLFPIMFISIFPDMSQSIGFAYPYNIISIISNMLLTASVYITGIGIILLSFLLFWPHYRNILEERFQI